MGDYLLLDVVDRPQLGALRAMRDARARARSGAAGLRALIPLQTARFSRRAFPPAVTARRVGVLGVWESAEAVPEGWEGWLADGARESWHLEGEVTRASFTQPWRGWVPSVEGTPELRDDEPALILISGDLRGRYVPVFLRDSAAAFGQADDLPGYLGGLGVASSPLNTTSCSGWRTYADAKAYAYSAGQHREAMRRDLANHHHRTQWFLRIRPVRERGTLEGRELFAGLLHGSSAPAG